VRIHWYGKRIGCIYSALIIGALIQKNIPDYAWLVIPLLTMTLSIEKD
jgi:hypothetical protein